MSFASPLFILPNLTSNAGSPVQNVLYHTSYWCPTAEPSLSTHPHPFKSIIPHPVVQHHLGMSPQLLVMLRATFALVHCTVSASSDLRTITAKHREAYGAITQCHTFVHDGLGTDYSMLCDVCIVKAAVHPQSTGCAVRSAVVWVVMGHSPPPPSVPHTHQYYHMEQ